jgi:hypothetical protein
MYITFFPEIVPFRRKCGKNIAEWVRPQMTIWYTRFACHITKATNTHSEYLILIAFPLQQWLQESTSVLRYTYIACPVITVYDVRFTVRDGSVGFFLFILY